MVDLFDVFVKVGVSSNHREALGSLISMLGVAETKVQKLLKATGGLKTAFAGIAAIGTIKVVSDLVKHGDTLLHQQALMANAGMSQQDIAQATAQAWKTTGDALGSSVADNMASLRELRQVFGSTAAAAANLTTLTRASLVLTNLRGGDEESGRDETFNLAKALEMKGVSNDPAHFRTLLEGMVRAEEANGGRVTGAGFLSAFKYGRGATAGWSDEFVTRYLPTLIQEFSSSGGGQGGPGAALASAYQAIVGGTMSNKAAEAFAQLGLIDPGKVIKTKTGSIKGLRAGAVTGADEFQANPYSWVQDVLLPALRAHGITDPAKERETISHMFSNRLAQQIISILATQKQRMEKDAANNDSAQGIDGAIKTLSDTDPTFIMKQFDAEWTNLLTALGGPLATAAIPIMRDLTAGIKDLDGFLLAHPEAGKTLEAIGLGFGAWGTLSSVAAIVRVLGAVSGAGSFGALATGLTGMIPATAGAVAGILLVNKALGELDNVAHLIWGENSTAADAAKNARPAPSWYPSWLPHYPFLKPPGDNDSASGIHKESYTPTGGRPIIIQATFVSTLDGRVIARNTSEHQARSMSLPPSGPTGFDGKMQPSWPSSMVNV